MIKNSQAWLQKRSISTWKRVRLAGLSLVLSVAAVVFLGQYERGWAIVVFLLFAAPSFIFSLGSLAAILVYKMSGGFPQHDRLLGERFALAMLVVREEIPGGREAVSDDEL